MEANRRDELMLLVDYLAGEHSAWAASETPFLTRAFETAINDTIQVFAIGSIPIDCRSLTSRVEELAQQWDRWKQRAASTGEECPKADAFWKALQAVEEAWKVCENKTAPRPASVAELTEQNVPDRQICLIYGWLDARGEPDIYKLDEERTRPGTHVGQDFVMPVYCEEERQIETKDAIVATVRDLMQQRDPDRDNRPADTLSTISGDDLDMRIVELFDGGIEKPSQISAMLAKQNCNVSRQRVQAALSRRGEGAVAREAIAAVVMDEE